MCSAFVLLANRDDESELHSSTITRLFPPVKLSGALAVLEHTHRCTYIGIYIYPHIDIVYIYIYIRIYICVYTHIHTCTHTHTHMQMCVCVCECTYMFAPVFVAPPSFPSLQVLVMSVYRWVGRSVGSSVRRWVR